MKNILILGGGTAGTIMANRLQRRLAAGEWQITVVDRSPVHYYQPGFLFIPFGLYRPEQVVRQKREFLPAEVKLVIDEAARIEADQNAVALKSGQTLSYDYLIIATGAEIHPEETEGLKGSLWGKAIFDFYTFEGAQALAAALETWPGGRLVVNITEMPIKCPVAPLEFLFLADDFFTRRGQRDKVELHLVTPLSGAFTRPQATRELEGLLKEKGIRVTPDFSVARVDNEQKKLVAWDEQAVDFDLLVTIPTNMGDGVIAQSGLGDELNFVATDKHTLRSARHGNIFVIGDATDLPASKAGSVAHFESDVLADNILSAIAGEPLTAEFDGHANCFIESGHGKGLLIDFNYETEPVPGTFPLPYVGPFSLLKESRLNHLGKLAFRHVYWHLLLPGYDLPLMGTKLSLAGKELA